MAFSLDKFYKINRRVLIWVILLGLLWILRDFFGLIFLTFLLTFFATRIVLKLQQYLRLPRRGLVVLVYGVIVLAFGTFVSCALPGIRDEAYTFLRQLGSMEKTLIRVKTNVVKDYPLLNTVINDSIRGELPDDALASAGIPAREQKILALKGTRDALAEQFPGRAPEQILASPNDYTTTVTQAAAQCRDIDRQLAIERAEYDEALMHVYLSRQAVLVSQQIPYLVTTLGRIIAAIFLALLFSFLISLDIGRLGREIQSLRSSRLSDFYEEAAQPVVRFTYVLGRAFQAQAIIALVNATLTLIGLLILGVPSVAVLTLTVFLCGFIPVAGVIISTVPILLVALNSGGLTLGMAVIALIVIIHMIEAYILNPMIYGHHMQLNPVLVLIILFVGHHLFPLWGMLLGVPVTYYFLHDVFGVPIFGSRTALAAPARPAAESETAST